MRWLSKYHQQQVRTVTSFEALTGLDLETEFNRLASTWRSEVQFSSSLDEIIFNFSYQRIIGLGVDALPLILRELSRSLEHWFWALSAISGHEPDIEEEGDMEALQQAWLKWGRERGLLAAHHPRVYVTYKAS